MDKHLISYIVKMGEDVLDPARVLSQDLEADSLALASPVVDVLPKEAHLRRHGWYPVGCEHVVVSITAHFVSDDLIRITLHDAIWERRIFGYILEDSQHARGSVVDVIGFATVEWPYKVIT